MNGQIEQSVKPKPKAPSRDRDIGILYDIERDGPLEVGDCILIHADGRRERKPASA